MSLESFAGEQEGGIFSHERIGFRNPLREAHDLFSRAAMHPLLLSLAAQEAIDAISRVIPAYRKEGKRAWDRLLSPDESDVVGFTYRKGFELARLFLTTEQVYADTVTGEVYTSFRKNVVQSFVEQLADMPLSQMGEVYRKVGLQPQRDGRLKSEALVVRRAVARYLH